VQGVPLKSGAALLYLTQNSFDVVEGMYIKLNHIEVGNKLTVLLLYFIFLGKHLKVMLNPLRAAAQNTLLLPTCLMSYFGVVYKTQLVYKSLYG